MTLSKKWATILAIANLAVAVVMSLVWYNLYWKESTPVVLQDELLFSYLAIVDPHSSVFSNTVFSALFSSASSCGVDFLACGRIINVILWIAFSLAISVVIYLYQDLATAIFGVWVSTSSISFFVVSFLPEIMYYTLVSFALLLLVAAYFSAKRFSIFSLFSGFLFGLAMLTKPHAIFILLLAIFSIPIIVTIYRAHSIQRYLNTLVVLLSAFATRLVIELSVSNRNPLDLFGRYLGGGDAMRDFREELPIQEPAVEAEVNSSLLEAMSQSFLPYLIVGLIFYVPPAIVGVGLAVRNRSAASSANVALVILSFVALGMLFISFSFGAYVTTTGDDHTNRLLLRYSEFLVPLTWIMLVASVSKSKNSLPGLWPYSVAPPLLGAIGIALGGLTNVALSTTDSLLVFSLSGPLVWFLLVLLGITGLLLQASYKSKTLLLASVSATTIALITTSYSQVYEQSTFHLSEAKKWAPIVSSVEEFADEDVIFIGSKRATVASLLLTSGKLHSKYGLVNGYSEIPPDWLEGFAYAAVSSEIYPPSDSREIATTEDGAVTLYELRSEAGILQDLYIESPDVANFTAIGVVTDWGYWVEGLNSDVFLRTPVDPGDSIVVQLIRHQSTDDETLTFLTDDGPISVNLPVAGRLYEVEITAGQEGISNFSISYTQQIKIAYVEGMDEYSFGVGKISVFSGN